MSDKRNRLIKKNEEMSQNWRERSGMAFALSANVIEAQFKNLIDQINTEIEVLTKVKMEMNRADEEISRDIEVS